MKSFTQTSLRIVENLEQLVVTFLQNKVVVPLDVKLKQEVTVYDIDARQGSSVVYDTFLGKIEESRKTKEPIYVFWKRVFAEVNSEIYPSSPEIDCLVVFQPRDHTLYGDESVTPLTRLKILPYKSFLPDDSENGKKEQEKDWLCRFIERMPEGSATRYPRSRVTLLEATVKSDGDSPAERYFKEYQLITNLGEGMHCSLENSSLFGAYERNANGQIKWKTHYKDNNEYWQKEVEVVRNIFRRFTEPMKEKALNNSSSMKKKNE